MSYRFHHLPSSGFSTIEQALVLPFIIMLVLGMIDITNVLRAKYTADEGVRSALRCAIATDSACGISTASPPKSERYFRVDLLPPDEEQVPVVDIEADVEYLTVQPEVYAPVLRDPPEERFQFSVARYEATATIPYVVESLPFIQPDPRREDGYLFSGSRVNDEGGIVAGNSAPRAIRIMGETTLRSERGRVARREFTFEGISASHLPTAPDGSLLPCAKDLSLSKRSEPGRCRTTTNSIPAFIYIKAKSPTLPGPVDRQYQAEVELTITIGDTKRELGGRRFVQRVKSQQNSNYPGSEAASLVPRGARTTHVDEEAKDSREEFEAHSKIDLPIGKDFKLEVKVFPSGGSTRIVEWQIEYIDVLLPDYIPHEEKVACQAPVDTCQLKGNECKLTSAFGERARVSQLARGNEVKGQGSLGCYADARVALQSLASSSCGEELRLTKGESCGMIPGSIRRWDTERFSFSPTQCSEQPSFSKPLPSGTELVRLERLPSNEKPERVASATQKELKKLKEGTSDKYRCDRFERKETKLHDLPDLNWKKPYLILLTGCTNDPSSVLPTLPEGVYYTNASLVRTGEFRAPLPGVTLPSCADKRIAPSAGPVTPLGEFKEGEFPEICKTQSCLSSVTRIVTLSDHAAHLPDLKMAEKVGVESMEGLFGQLQDDKSSYRGSVSTKYLTKTGAPPKADLSDAQAVEVTTTVTVPSLLSIPGSGSTYSVSSSRTQRIEKSFIR